MNDDSIQRGNRLRTNLREIYSSKTPAIVWTEGSLETSEGKTTHRLIRHDNLFKVCGIVDSQFTDKHISELNGYPLDDEIPVFKSLTRALTVISPDVFIIGTAPLGGGLSDELLSSVESALEHGLDVLSGLHDRLTDNKSLVDLAERHDCRLIDLRKAPPEQYLAEADGRPDNLSCTVVTVLGTDCVVGKGTTTYQLYQAASSEGYDTAFVATGQTGMLTGSRYGIPTDKIPLEYAVGVVEDVVHAAAADHDVVFVEGQAALSHPRFVGDDILKGSQPDYVVLADDPSRDSYIYFDAPKAGVDREIKLVEGLADTSVVAVSSWNADKSKHEIESNVVVVNILDPDGPCRIINRITGL